MMVLILTNLFPTKDNPNSGIFITKRLKEHEKLGVDFTAVSLTFRDKGRLLSLLRSLLRKPSEVPLKELEGVSFKPVFVKDYRNLETTNPIFLFSFILMNKQFEGLGRDL
ncbi:MAG: teichuronic acid biosynthesis glycosyltransferase TuaC [Thermotogaceae bacterium]|nr:teichuronic acid biosynthesis glycosyltransferase TuaC [Thermotogaceae bacterium]